MPVLVDHVSLEVVISYDIPLRLEVEIRGTLLYSYQMLV